MADYDNTRYYWLQLREEFFESDEIDWLEEQPNGPAQVLFYLKLCLKSLKTNGLLVRRVGQMLIPYDAEKLADFTRSDVNTVQCAIVNLKMCGLVEVLEDGTIFMAHLSNLIGSASGGALKKQQQRARRELVKSACRPVVDDEVDKCPPEYRDKRLETRREDMGGNSAPLDDYDLIAEKAKTATVVHIQRSRGYTQRNAFDLATIQKVADTARKANPNAVIFVDNCYGEFTQTAEPVAFGADIMAGSFIKNPGGGITPTGGYIAGRKDLVEKCSHRFTAPGIGGDLGCTQDSLRDTFLGFYYAPGVVCEALKTAIYAQCLLELAGVNPVPRYTADHNDIVTCFDSGSAAALTGFCAGIQHNSPVDSFASPEPADEPGYNDKVVMASGSFTEGSTIEISCDGPLRAPYTCYLQGGVNFTAGRAAVLNAVQNAFFAE